MNAQRRRSAHTRYSAELRSMQHGLRPTWGAVLVLGVSWTLLAVVVLVALAAVIWVAAWMGSSIGRLWLLWEAGAWIGSSLARLWMNGGGL